MQGIRSVLANLSGISSSNIDNLVDRKIRAIPQDRASSELVLLEHESSKKSLLNTSSLASMTKSESSLLTTSLSAASSTKSEKSDTVSISITQETSTNPTEIDPKTAPIDWA